MPNVDEFMSRQYRKTAATLPVSLPLEGKMIWPDWRAAMGDALSDCLGRTPAGNPPLRATLIWKREREGYAIEKLAYESEHGLTAPFFRLTPNGVSAPAKTVMAICGHGYGVRDIVALMPDEAERTGDPGYHKDFAVELVKRGFVVYAPELLGFGELRLLEQVKTGVPGRSSCERIGTQLLLEGRTLLGARVHQVRRLMDLAVAEGMTDPARIGMMGISGGGMVTTYTTALDERVRACVVSGYANSYRDSIMGMHHCLCNFLPGILKYGEMADFLSLIAPRPMLWEAGTLDPIFPLHATMQSRAVLQKVYGALGASDRFDIDVFEGVHQISGAKAYDFLLRWV